MIDRISILGTGLIGGSLALSWQEHRPNGTIVGHDRPDVLTAAEERGAIDEKAADPVTAVEDADLVVLATPLATILKLLDTIGGHLPEGCFVTDVGSVKQPVVDQATDVLPDHVQFLGGHPMAGAEDAGIEHADPLLFENAVYALSLPSGGDEDAFGESYAPLIDLIETTGARPLQLAPDRHDRLVAAMSHLPQLLAVALANTAAEADDANGDDGTLALELAGGGFRDMTRIAASPFSVWRDILVGNEGAILDAMSSFRRTLRRLRNRLIENDLDALEGAFDDARRARDAVPGDTKGFLHPLSEVYVKAPDEPGVLHDLTGHLSDADLNVKDIELQTVREGTGGTFRLAFADRTNASAAVEALRAAGYDAWRPE
jgi:prephenate dehydrogenase